jgi:3-isopropylmalate/(R)-2-methylmalate dehydratase small subunit
VVEQLAGDAVTIDLPAQTVTHDAARHSFAIDPEARQMLAQGLDAIDLTLAQSEAIANWIAADRALRPWVYLSRRTKEPA